MPSDYDALIIQDRNHAVERQAVLETQVAALEAALSAIRALVQQWEEYYALRSNEKIGAFVLKRWIDQLAALCPAPPEDQK